MSNTRMQHPCVETRVASQIEIATKKWRIYSTQLWNVFVLQKLSVFLEHGSSILCIFRQTIGGGKSVVALGGGSKGVVCWWTCVC